jgi:hypothetical protein
VGLVSVDTNELPELLSPLVEIVEIVSVVAVTLLNGHVDRKLSVVVNNAYDIKPTRIILKRCGIFQNYAFINPYAELSPSI